MATSAVIKGVNCEASLPAQITLASPINKAIYTAALSALDGYYSVRPVGSDTASSLRARIALSYTEYLGSTWQGPITAEAVAYDPNFTTWVMNCSPLSEKLSGAQQDVVAKAKMSKNILMFGGALLGALALVWVFTGNRKASAPAAPVLPKGVS
jgi:hypothetical protein